MNGLGEASFMLGITNLGYFKSLKLIVLERFNMQNYKPRAVLIRA